MALRSLGHQLALQAVRRDTSLVANHVGKGFQPHPRPRQKEMKNTVLSASAAQQARAIYSIAFLIQRNFRHKVKDLLALPPHSEQPVVLDKDIPGTARAAP